MGSRTYAAAPKGHRQWVACDRCGPRSWVFAGRGIRSCTRCGADFPAVPEAWPAIRPAKRGPGGKGGGKAKPTAPAAQGGEASGAPPPGDGRLGLGKEAAARVRALLANSSEELRGLLLPALVGDEEAAPEPKGPDPVVAAGRRLGAARGALQQAGRKLEKGKAEVERLEELLAAARAKVPTLEEDLGKAEAEHKAALDAYNSTAGAATPLSEGGEANESSESDLDREELIKKIAEAADRKKRLDAALRRLDARGGEDRAAGHHKKAKLASDAAELERQAVRAAEEAEKLRVRAQAARAEAEASEIPETRDEAMEERTAGS